MRKGKVLFRGKERHAGLQRAQGVRMVRWRIACPAILLCSFFSCATAQEIPAGFQVERYARLWERNPFLLVTPAGPQAQPSVFDKLFLTSWMKYDGGEVIFVQNSETNEVLQITHEPGQNNLRLVELDPSPNLQFVAAIISDGKEQGEVKFRCDFQPATGETHPGTAIRAAMAPEPSPHLVQNISHAQTAGLPRSAPIQKIIPHPVYPGRLRVRMEGGAGPSLRRE